MANVMPTNEKEFGPIPLLQDPTKQVDYWHPTIKGFGLRVSSGSKTFVLVYRNATGRKQRMTFGKWPGLTLDAATKLAKANLALVAGGTNPAAEKQEARRKGDFEAICSRFKLEFLGDTDKVRPSTKKEWDRIVDRIVEHWGSASPSPDEMGRKVLKPWFATVKKDNGPYMANRFFEVMRRIFSWAIEEEVIEWTPFVKMKAPARETSRSRALTLAEIKAVLESIKQERPMIQTMWSMYFETLARRTEVASARWKDINFEERLWSYRGKGKGEGKEQILPLSTQMVKRLEALQQLTGHTDFLFASPHTHLDKKGKEGPITNTTKLLIRVRQRTGITDIRLHDIRRTGATRMAELFDTKDGIIASILNHSKKLDNDAPDITAIYQRARKLAPMREAVQSWADWLEGVSNGTIKVGEVTKISSRAAM